MEDELAERFYRIGGPQFQAAFDKAAAQWLSRDCHRSQYGYPIRVGLQLALENRHRSVTLATFSCSGAEIANGLFLEMDPREGFSEPGGKKVRAQFDQLTDLLCRGNARQQASYTLPMYATGSTSISQQRVTMNWCPPGQRKRPIDLVLMSVGGNDVGFGGLVAYAMTESAADFAPIAAWIGSSIRFSPQVSRVYMDALDERMKALKDALQQGFGVEPSKVLQTTYEPIQYDEKGQLCGEQPTLGMDVHPGLKLHQGPPEGNRRFPRRLPQSAAVHRQSRRPQLPGNLATGAGTGFKLITDHVPEFTRRGMCARDPKRALQDGVAMRVPRLDVRAEAFKPVLAGGRRCPMPATGGCSAPPMTRSWRRTPTARACWWSTSCSRPMRASTAAPSIRPRKAIRSSPTMSFATRAAWSTSAQHGADRGTVISRNGTFSRKSIHAPRKRGMIIPGRSWRLARRARAHRTAPAGLVTLSIPHSNFPIGPDIVCRKQLRILRVALRYMDEEFPLPAGS